MQLEKRSILYQIRSLLQYHKCVGIHNYTRSEELDSLMQLQLHSENVKMPPRQAQPPQAATKVEPAIISTKRQGNIVEIAEEVRDCHSCNLYESRLAAVAGVGGSEVRLMIIGGWLTASSNREILKSSVLGIEEDKMLARMLTAINLSEEQSFVTNIIKCGITESVQPKKENIDACMSYLYRQIAAISPDIICTMGIIATRALLQNSRPLSQLRGKFHAYKVDQKRTIDVMPTYHPSFLIKNPEMKMATWNDLQRIEKRLQRK